MIVRLRNRRGVESEVPTEFLRLGPDAKPALRRGVSLAVTYFARSPAQDGPFFNGPHEDLKPKRTDRFDPKDGTRPLAAFESLDAMQIDLTDWFDLTKPGSYSVRLQFTDESGFGEGMSNDASFTVRGGGASVR